MNKILVEVLLMLLLVSCDKSNVNPIYEFENYEKLESEFVIISNDSIFLGRPYSLSLIKDNIVMYDFYDQKMLTWYSLTDNKTKHNVSMGNGPGEFIPPLYIFSLGDDKVKLYERSNGTFYTYEWSDVYNDNLKNPISVDRLKIFGENAVPCGQNYLLNDMQDDLNLFSLISPDGDVISRFGRYPGELNENMDSKSLGFLTQCLVGVDNLGERMVAAGYMSDMLSFYKKVGDEFVLYKEYFTKNADIDIQKDASGWHTRPNENTLNTYLSLCFSKDKLFALYWGTKEGEKAEKSYIQVFDLDGCFIKGFVVPECLKTIAVNETGELLYGISFEDEISINVYNLEDKLD